MGHHHQTNEAFKGVDEGVCQPFAGRGLRPDRQPELGSVGREQVTDRVEPRAVELEKILEGVLV